MGIHMESSVHRLPSQYTNSYAREENSGSTRKFVENYNTYCLRVLPTNSCTAPVDPGWVEGTFLDSGKEVPPAHAQGVCHFLRNFLMNQNFLLVHRNRYSERMDYGQMTPRGYPNFNSYIKNLRVLVFRTDRRTEKLIRCGLGNLSVPPGKQPCLTPVLSLEKRGIKLYLKNAFVTE